MTLQRLLEDAAPPHTEVFDAPVDLRLPGGHVLQPDLVIAPVPSVVRPHIELPVLLVVEIVSRGSGLRLVDDAYETVLDTGGEVATEAPLAVRFAVADLFRPPS